MIGIQSVTLLSKLHTIEFLVTVQLYNRQMTLQGCGPDDVDGSKMREIDFINGEFS